MRRAECGSVSRARPWTKSGVALRRFTVPDGAPILSVTERVDGEAAATRHIRFERSWVSSDEYAAYRRATQALAGVAAYAPYVTATLARHDPHATRVFEDQIRALPQIIAADNVAGEMDYMLTVVARDVSELQEVLASLSTRGGQRLVTYLRLAEVKPPSRLPLVPTTPEPDSAAPPRRRRRAARS